MEELEQESLDGSSIKPVSSLLCHFEQMANAQPTNNTATRGVSPKGFRNIANSGDAARAAPAIPNRPETISHLADSVQAARGRDAEASDVTLRPPRANGGRKLSPSPTRVISPRPTSTAPPAVTVQPPQSPQKIQSSNVSLANIPAYLSTDAPFSASSNTSSQGQFRIPSRSNTPLSDTKNSSSYPSSLPPSPPPPRRSGEVRRNSSFRVGPPPINRADKPKISSKPVGFSSSAESVNLAPISVQIPIEKTSPFSSPPSSGGSLENEYPVAPSLPRNRPRPVSYTPSSRSFEPPPRHHGISNRQRDQEANGLGRSLISAQFTGGDRRPALPNRAHVTPEISSNRPMPPPPPRPPVDRSRPPVTNAMLTEGGLNSATPQKRVLSNPTGQLQTPPRSHGRSMTVDRTSDRTPAEFRTPIVSVSTRTDPRPSMDVPSTPVTREGLSFKAGEYPDTSHSNRRPPYFAKGTYEIPTKYDTRILDVCGEYVCTTGHITRVWSLLDGGSLMTLPHTEGIKFVSVAFKPAAEVQNEGSRLWLGNNIGDLIEVDISSGSIVTSKSNAHTRREIIKIYRHSKELWTLDDGGTLHLWAPDDSGEPNLTNPSQSYRLPKGHTFSLVVDDELWYVAGKDIRIFIPTLDGSAQFQVLQRPIHQPDAGEITSGAVINSQPDRIYFGHVDGKVSIYSRHDYACLGIINISVYKITSLVGVGSYLWAGFSTGMVYVYDTTYTPWVAKKDWRAHHDPLIGLFVDRSSFWMLDREHVISLGQDNMIRAWDGMLQDDWMEQRMQSQEADFCKLTPIKTLVMTWNAGASTPYHLQQSDQDSRFLPQLLQDSDRPDILVFGFQELVDLEDKKTTAKSFFKSKKKEKDSDHEHMSHQYRNWRDFLIRCLDDYVQGEIYHLLHTANLVGLFTCVFVRSPLLPRIKNINAAEVKRGMGGLHGNKGALILRFVLDDTSMCFINCHLAAGQTQTKDRNTDISMILESQVLPAERDHGVRIDTFVGGGDGTMILDHEICILNGDLNYRIDTMGRDTVVNAVKANNLAKLLERDQLLASKRKNPWFRLRAFHELPITFAPTYKYDVGTDNYDTSEKKRAPAWCDRLLYRGHNRVEQLDYRRHEVRVSDHRPVTGLFNMVVKTIYPQKRAVKWEECLQNFQRLKEQLGAEARLDYLTNVVGFDLKTSQKIVASDPATHGTS
ncbi:357d7e47-23fa-46b4-997c-d78e43c8742c [Sclerotinia trifoliorum]|uniref:357d7e47-23fa-46b4-997c-d78e43c8742c n=1 Tax=Sclerotinia trifoliorum TaxID=28548 RepID=A0A8H2VR98_9HELO|nr:357d7e47-23fa-46b4-997c-d78e43c8742c [Sclerotinia trifoliorum]